LNLQVLYSQFVKLLEEGKVQTARLESGTSRVYFDVIPPEETESPAAASTSSAAATRPTSEIDSRTSTATATTTGTPDAAAASNVARQKFQRQFFIKVHQTSLGNGAA
jgi:hypothetical protein